ncbi:hypothetical protein C8Q72DRAFT_299977 [Fomitopsis betulina]|nr:hypothetical protein C8Q72DRAFT_299977 [Fomitopsis betulina]
MSPSPTISNILGPVSIGIILSSIVYGINCLQMYLYYTRHSKDGDGAFLKAYVALLILADTTHVVLLVMAYYHYTVTCFGDRNAFEVGYRPLLAEVFVGNIVILMVQHFYAVRIYNICGKRVLPFVISVLSTAQAAVAIAFMIKGFQIHLFILANSLIPYTEAGLACDIVCDALIAATLIYYLKARRTVFPGTNRTINRLVAYALNTCLFTTILSLVTLIMIPFFSETMIYSVLYFVLVRLYTCTLLSTLNSRDIIKQALEGHNLVKFPSARVGVRRPDIESDSAEVASMKWASTPETQE